MLVQGQNFNVVIDLEQNNSPFLCYLISMRLFNTEPIGALRLFSLMCKRVAAFISTNIRCVKFCDELVCVALINASLLNKSQPS